MSPLPASDSPVGQKRKGTPDEDVGSVDVSVEVSPTHSVKSSDIQSAFALIETGEVSFLIFIFFPPPSRTNYYTKLIYPGVNPGFIL